MTRAPSFDDVFAVMSEASVGDVTARVEIPSDIEPDEIPTRFAVALNLLLDDLAYRSAETVTLNLALQEANADLERRVDQRTEQLRRAINVAEAANKELEAFAYSVSHDLRAPLRGIDGFSQALLEDHAQQLSPDGQQFLRRIRAAAQRMAELIDDLLDLSRVSRSDLRLVQADLSSIALAVVAELRKADPLRHVDVLLGERVVADADPKLIRIALENLLGNAWKFTANTPAPRIEFGATSEGPEPVYFVRDNGAGFNMAYVARLFGAFQRLHSDKEFSGTGIGLATVQRIVLRHGGRIWAEGTVGNGATFYFTLPQGDRQP